MRAKTIGVPVTSHCLVTGFVEVLILDQYFECFPVSRRKGKFFRYLKWSFGNEGSISGTDMNVGKNTTGNYGKLVAARLGYSNPERWTGHCWRRTCATLCAESGLQLADIKLVTGHTSDTVVMRYIDSSDKMKRKAATALSVGGSPIPKRITPTNDDVPVVSPSPTASSIVYNISYNNCTNMTHPV